MIYLTSDLHGYPIDKFLYLLDEVKFSSKDTLYILGDVIDRGPDGIRLLKWCMRQPNVKLLMGNHERLMLRCESMITGPTEISSVLMHSLDLWMSNGGDVTLEALRNESVEMRYRILDYIRDLPIYFELTVDGQKYVLVHAGLGGYEQGREMSDYCENELTWERPSLDTEYSHDFITIFGHTPTCYMSRYSEGSPIKSATWWNIDTGAACGLWPTIVKLGENVN